MLLHLLRQKLERLRQLKIGVGPLPTHADGVTPLVDKLALFEDPQYFMARVSRRVASALLFCAVVFGDKAGVTRKSLCLDAPDIV